jgi:hypothetical protein
VKDEEIGSSIHQNDVSVRDVACRKVGRYAEPEDDGEKYCLACHTLYEQNSTIQSGQRTYSREPSDDERTALSVEIALARVQEGVREDGGL